MAQLEPNWPPRRWAVWHMGGHHAERESEPPDPG